MRIRPWDNQATSIVDLRYSCYRGPCRRDRARQRHILRLWPGEAVAAAENCCSGGAGRLHTCVNRCAAFPSSLFRLTKLSLVCQANLGLTRAGK